MVSNMKRPPFLSDVRPGCGIQAPATMGGSWALIIFLLFSRGFCAKHVQLGAYWYQGVFLTQRSVNPASVRILIEAASASRTVSFTDCMRF